MEQATLQQQALLAVCRMDASAVAPDVLHQIDNCITVIIKMNSRQRCTSSAVHFNNKKTYRASNYVLELHECAVLDNRQLLICA